MATFEEVKNEFFVALKAATKPREDENAATLTGAGTGTKETVGGLSQEAFEPTMQTGQQIYTAQQAVRSLSNHLQHPCSINHDAATTGVRHACMAIHPEWNHEHVKEQAEDHLTSAGFKGKKSDGFSGMTYEHPQTGAKVHVATVGKHVIISSDDIKGTKGTPYTPPVDPEEEEMNNRKRPMRR